MIKRSHFQQRIFERFGIFPDKQVINQLISIIEGRNKHNIPTLVKTQDSLKHYKVRCYGQDIIVVYDPQRKRLVTALFTTQDKYEEFKQGDKK